MDISSPQNQRIKELVKLQRNRYRAKTGRLIVEGVRLVEEALETGFLQEAYASRQLENSERGRTLIQWLKLRSIPLWTCSPEALQKGGETSTNPGIVGIASQPHADLHRQTVGGNGFVLWADEIGDPGNLGTLIRTAAAAGADAVMLSAGSVDPWNSKTVRASMGAVFRVPVCIESRQALVSWCFQEHVAIAVADSARGRRYDTADLSQRLALVIGSEAHGVHADVAENARLHVCLPMHRGVDSLNAAAAAAILLYECRRQRDAQGSTPTGPDR